VTRTFINADTSVSSSQPGYITGTNVTNGSTKFCLDTVVNDHLDRIHARTHQGKAFIVSHIFSIAASTGVDVLLDLTSSTLHTAFQVCTGANSYFQLFEGATVSANGTELTAINNNRSAGTTTAHKFYFTPTVSNDGSTLCAFVVPGGAGTFAAGGEGGGLPRGGAEWVLAASTKYLCRLTNRSNAAIEGSISFTFYGN